MPIAREIETVGCETHHRSRLLASLAAVSGRMFLFVLLWHYSPVRCGAASGRVLKPLRTSARVLSTAALGPISELQRSPLSVHRPPRSPCPAAESEQFYTDTRK